MFRISVYYFSYMDGVVGGVRVNLLPQVFDVRNNKYAFTDLYVRQSVFRSAWDKLNEYGVPVKKESLPKSLYDHIFDIRPEVSEERRTEVIDEIERSMRAVSYDTLKSMIPSGKAFHGYVWKDDLYRYENGDAEYLERISPEELREMCPEEKDLIVYHEWDDEYSDSFQLRCLMERVQAALDLFYEVNYLDEVSDIRIIVRWS